jgi:hypothetical protein
MPRTNAERTKDRIESDSASLIARIHSAIKDYGENQFGEPLHKDEWAVTVRDALTEIRHICDMLGLDYGDLDKSAHHGYLCELAYTEADEAETEPQEEVTTHV